MQERANQPKQKIEYNFDITKHIRLVPPFQEKEVDKYFLHFEKVAENLNWPKEHWTLLLQSVLIGKAREIYTQLGVEQSHHYETVKELILKGYELVPEAYRQKFRNCKKDSNQTHVEFARNKEQLFDRWCCSKKIDQNYDTGASQSLILADILPFSEKASSGTSVLIQGVECGTVNIPLHHVNLSSDLVTGPMVIGIKPSLPFKGVRVLLGNDLAGDKVVVNPL